MNARRIQNVSHVAGIHQVLLFLIWQNYWSGICQLNTRKVKLKPWWISTQEFDLSHENRKLQDNKMFKWNNKKKKWRKLFRFMTLADNKRQIKEPPLNNKINFCSNMLVSKPVRLYIKSVFTLILFGNYLSRFKKS